MDVRTTTEVVVPAQILCDIDALVIVGIGFTVTTRFFETPAQFVDDGPDGVIIYVTVPEVEDPAGNDKISSILPLPEGLNPDTEPEVTEAVQVKLEPVTLLAGV